MGTLQNIIKDFSGILSPLLAGLFQACFDDNRLPVSWAEAKVVLLPKQGKDLTVPQSYRPILLLNNDYKILTTVLANRLNKVLESYIHKDQGWFIKGRQIQDCTQRVCNIIDSAEIVCPGNSIV